MAQSTRPPIPVALLAAVQPYSDGVGIERLMEDLPWVPRRTLQRHLARLVAEGRVEAHGRASARRYFLPRVSSEIRHEPTLAPPFLFAAEPSEGEWVSEAGAEVARNVCRPLAQRRPVGYQREFLTRYRPNRDAYLPVAVRRHLHHLGRSPDGERPAGTFARQILDRLRIDLSWASSRLEGNTYTRLDTQNLLAFGQIAQGKDRREAQMILNHKGAIEMLVGDAESVRFDRYTLQNLHALLADNLLADPDAVGRLRTIPVSISGTTYQPTGIPAVIEEAFDTLLQTADAIEDPFEQAFFAMVHVPYLQPFEDVNKRVSRVAANIPLIRQNLAPLSFVDVADTAYVEAILGVYELNRVELLCDLFVWAYERSCQRYTVLREALPAPDPLRLRYRAELAAIVREAVRSGGPIDAADLANRAQAVVPPADAGAIAAMALNELFRLHEGSIARFGLRLGEFRAWEEAGARHRA
jgi:hypothetical protein